MSKNNYYYMKRDVMEKIIPLTEERESTKEPSSFLDHFTMYMNSVLYG